MAKFVAVQPEVHLAYPDSDTFDPDAIRKNIDNACGAIEDCAKNDGAKLVLFPEFFLTGYTLGVDVPGWIRASIRLPGPEIDRLCEAARKNRVYVAGAAYEVIDDFPGRFFNTAFLIAPSGDIVLRYRKHYAMTTKTRPVDVFDQWLDTFGEESLFPVAHTPLGRIGFLIARDAHWPEMARCLAMKGAEILLVPNAAGAEPEDGGRFARQSRAYENHCYVLTTNIGPMLARDAAAPIDGRAPCEAVDFKGCTMASNASLAPQQLVADFDIAALRRFRIEAAGKGNMLAQFQPAIHRHCYQHAQGFPVNHWQDEPIACNQENKELERRVIESMADLGIFARG